MDQLAKGKELFEKAAYQEAITILSDFLNTSNNNADALYIRAISFRKVGNFDRSIADFTVMLNRLPEEASLYCERGISYFHKKDIENALKDMNKAVEIEPNNPYRYSSRAYIRANIDVKGAASDYEKAIELDPEDEISHNNLGLLYESKGKINQAKKHFNKSNELIDYTPDKKEENKIEESRKEVIAPEPQTITKTMLSVFTSKTTRNEYFKFLKSIFKK